MRCSKASPAVFETGYALSVYADWLSFEGYPSQGSIAADAGLNERTVRDALVLLARLQFIETKRRGPTSNCYRLRLPPGDRERTIRGDHDQQEYSGLATDDRQEYSGLTENMTGRNIPSDRQEFSKRPAGILPTNEIRNEISERDAVAAARSRAPAAPARETIQIRKPPARENLKHSATAGSLARLTARSPAEEPESGINPPLVGRKIPQTCPELGNGAAPLKRRDDSHGLSPDDDCTDYDDEQRHLEKERREEERDNRIMAERAYRNVENIDDDFAC